MIGMGSFPPKLALAIACSAILGCSVHYDAARAEHHPDLSFYGIHGLEAMYALMGKRPGP